MLHKRLGNGKKFLAMDVKFIKVRRIINVFFIEILNIHKDFFLSVKVLMDL